MTKTEIGYLKKLGYVDTKEHGAVLFHPGISNALRIGVYITEDELDDALDKFDGHLLINIRIISRNEYMRGNYVIGMNKLITK